MRKENKRDWRNALMPLWAGVQLVLISVVIFCVFILLALLIIYADVLGGLFIPLLLAYFAVLLVVLGCILRRREKHNFLAAVGPEIYYQTYPREKRRMERREARAQKHRSKGTMI